MEYRQAIAALDLMNETEKEEICFSPAARITVDTSSSGNLHAILCLPESLDPRDGC